MLNEQEATLFGLTKKEIEIIVCLINSGEINYLTDYGRAYKRGYKDAMELVKKMQNEALANIIGATPKTQEAKMIKLNGTIYQIGKQLNQMIRDYGKNATLQEVFAFEKFKKQIQDINYADKN